MSGELAICGTGWVPWPEFRALVPDWQAIWVDFDGPHVGAVPAEAPQASHLWAWSGDTWVRVRIEDGHAVAGFLHPSAQCPRRHGEHAQVRVSGIQRTPSWQEHHINVGDLRDQIWEMLEVHDEVASVFVRAGQG